MTIETTLTRVSYEGNGVTRIFPVPFPLLSAGHLQVYVTDRNVADDEIIVPLSSGYSVQYIDTKEPVVVYPEDAEAPALPAGRRLTLVRHLPLVQLTNLENGGNLQAEVLETQFDVIAMQIQQLAYDVTRSVKIAPYSQKETVDVTDILRAMEQLCLRAEAAAGRLEETADSTVLAGGMENLSATWISSGLLAGDLMDLPIHYVPGRNVLSLSVEGVLCYPGSVGSENTSFQYEEVGDEGIYSRKIRVLFPIPEGTVCHAHVMVSNLLPLSESLVERAESLAVRLESMLAQAGEIEG